MKKIELIFSALVPAMSQQYVLLLQEKDGTRRLPIVIGLNEAQAIAIEINQIPRIRPLTHDLFVNTLTAFGIDVIEIHITRIEDGVFYSELICEQMANGTRIRIDSRTSDAIALALRFKCLIFADEDVVKKASFTLEEIEKDDTNISEKDKIIKKIEDLEKRLDEAVKEENFELAAQLKKEIDRLKKII